jgi:hypothetical protein
VEFQFFEENTASLIYFSDDLPEIAPDTGGMIIFSEGSVTLDEVTSNRCKGRIEVNGIPDDDGTIYYMKGNFDTHYVEI